MGVLAHGVLALTKKARLLAVVLALMALGGVLIWRGFDFLSIEKRFERPAAQPPATAQPRLAAGEAARDSDGDGLKDWEEDIWRTDPNKSDTDGDGTPDGEEIAKNRDPLKKGPNDKLASPYPLSPAPSPDDNLTFNLTKNLLESGVLGAIDREGRITSTDFLENLSLPKNLNPETLLSRAAVVTEKDLTLSSRNDPEGIKHYFNALHVIYAQHIAPHQKRSDLAILTEVLRGGNYAKLTELDPIIRALERTVAEVKKTPVPRDYRSFAVRELNYLLETKRALEIFSNTQNDPIATAVVVGRRIELFQEMVELHRKTKADLDARGIVFNPQEGGYAYFQ